jgi:hypothetical protein
MEPGNPLYQSRQPRRIVVRPFLLTLALCCLVVGIYGYLIFRWNFNMLPQDGDKGPPPDTRQQAATQSWLDVGCGALPAGVIGLILVPFSIQYRRRNETVE